MLDSTYEDVDILFLEKCWLLVALVFLCPRYSVQFFHTLEVLQAQQDKETQEEMETETTQEVVEVEKVRQVLLPQIIVMQETVALVVQTITEQAQTSTTQVVVEEEFGVAQQVVVKTEVEMVLTLIIHHPQQQVQ